MEDTSTDQGLIHFILTLPRDVQGVFILGLVALVIWALLKVRGRLSRRRDPVRLFTSKQRKAAYHYAGGRCEYKPLFWRRCPARHNLQGDHIYPWSQGGRTIPSNLQMLCAKHNRRKSALVPNWWYIKRLEHRRRSYFPQGVSVKVRWR